MASPSFSINLNPVDTKASVAAAVAVTARIDDIAGVRQVEWTITRTDETSQPSDYTLVISGSVNQVASMTSLGPGTAAVLKAKINGGLVNDRPSDATIQENKFFVPDANNVEVLASGELARDDVVSSTSHGAVDPINRAIRLAGAGSVDWKSSARLATDGALLAHSFSAGVITFTADGNQTIDGVATALNDRIVLKEGTDLENGIYFVTTLGDGSTQEVWTRTADADATGEITNGTTIYVAEGTTNGDRSFRQVTLDPITINTTPQTWTEITTGLSYVSTPVTDRSVVTASGTAGDLVQENSNILITAGGNLQFGSSVSSFLNSVGDAIFSVPSGQFPTFGNASSALVEIISGGTLDLGADGTSQIVRVRDTHILFNLPGTAAATVGELRVANGWRLAGRRVAAAVTLSIIDLNASDIVTVGGTASGVRPNEVDIDGTTQVALQIAGSDRVVAGTITSLKSSDGQDRVAVTAADAVELRSVGNVSLRTGAGAGTLRWFVDSSSVEMRVPLLEFASAQAAPRIIQADDAVATLGDLMTYQAQSLVTAGGAKTAGRLLLLGGDCVGGATNVGGDSDVQGGDGGTAGGQVNLRASDGLSVIRVVDANRYERFNGQIANRYDATLQTTSGTQTVVAFTLAVSSDTILSVRLHGIGMESGGAVQDAIDHEVRASFVNDSGTLTQLGTDTDIHLARDDATWSVNFNISGTNVECRITGDATNNVDWDTHVEFSAKSI